MNPIFKQAVSGLVFLCALCTVQITSLSAQGSDAAIFSLETKVSYHGQSPTQFTAFQSEDGGEDILLAFITDNQLALGVGLRKVAANGWYSRYALMQLSLNEGARSARQIDSRTDMEIFTDGERIKSFNLRLRYERGKYFELGERFEFGLGVLFDPFFVSSKVNAFHPEAFPVRNNSIGLETGMVPQFTFGLSKRVNLYLEVPVVLLHVASTTTELDNPFINEPQRTTSVFTMDALANVQAGFGVQVRL